MRVSRRFAAALVTALIAFGPGRAPHAQDVVVFAAASLTNALDEAAKLFERQGGAHAKISYAASPALAKQIESGAPADIFISADLDWMNYLEQRHLIQPATRRNLLGNRLVLVAPADSDVHVEIKPGFDLAALLKGGRLAMADTDSVPAGKYGKAALEKLGVWNTVQPAVAPAETVRAALLFVSRREAPLGIVYATDAAADPAGQDRRGVPRGHPSADRLSGGSHRGQQEPERGAAAGFSWLAGGETDFRERGFHRSRARRRRIADLTRPSAAAPRAGARCGRRRKRLRRPGPHRTCRAPRR